MTIAFDNLKVIDVLDKRTFDEAEVIRDSLEHVQERAALAEVQRTERVNSLQSFAVQKSNKRKAVF